MALHEQSVGATDEWYTPPHVFEALGLIFEIDVAAPSPAVNAVRPTQTWIPAHRFITENALDAPWVGCVWMNPPFGKRNGLVPWLERFARHGNGIALVPDRTSAPWWQTYARSADATLFCTPKLHFIGRDGKPGKSPAQGTCLLAVGDMAVRAVRRAESKLGFAMRSFEPTWSASR